jgi:trans-aconitate methyltransferase
MVGSVASVDWNPDRYLGQMLEEIHDFERLQEKVALATAGGHVASVLELGIGTGETAKRVRAVHPHARWTGVDASEPMLTGAREVLPEAELVHGRLEDALPRPDHSTSSSPCSQSTTWTATVSVTFSAASPTFFVRAAGSCSVTL